MAMSGAFVKDRFDEETLDAIREILDALILDDELESVVSRTVQGFGDAYRKNVADEKAAGARPSAESLVD